MNEATTANTEASRTERIRECPQDDFPLESHLIQHVQQGLSLRRHLAASRAYREALEAALHTLSTPTIIVTRSGHILFMNKAADELLRRADGLVSVAGRLRASLPYEAASLSALILSAAQSAGGACLSSTAPLRITCPRARHPLEVVVSPLPASPDIQLLPQRPAAALLIRDRYRTVVDQDKPWPQNYGLTAGETRVIQAIARGLAGKEICRELQISYNTLKTHLKRIYLKTHTRNHCDLIRLISAGL